VENSIDAIDSTRLDGTIMSLNPRACYGLGPMTEIAC
jgi:hypothetical protein